MAIEAHWNTTIEPEERVDGLYHIYFSGAFNPTTRCGLHRGTPFRLWVESFNPAPELRCGPCVDAYAEIEEPRPPFAEAPVVP